MLWNMQKVLKNIVTLKMGSAVQCIFYVHVPCWHAGFAHLLGALSGRNDGQEGWQQWCGTQEVKLSEDWHRLLASKGEGFFGTESGAGGFLLCSLFPSLPSLCPLKTHASLIFQCHSLVDSLWIMGAEF